MRLGYNRCFNTKVKINAVSFITPYDEHVGGDVEDGGVQTSSFETYVWSGGEKKFLEGSQREK